MLAMGLTISSLGRLKGALWHWIWEFCWEAVLAFDGL